MCRVYIPPKSILYGHGHLTHCGASSHDSRGNGLCERMHECLVPEGYVLSDGINFDFVPAERITELRFDESLDLPLPAVHTQYANTAAGNDTADTNGAQDHGATTATGAAPIDRRPPTQQDTDK